MSNGEPDEMGAFEKDASSGSGLGLWSDLDQGRTARWGLDLHRVELFAVEVHREPHEVAVLLHDTLQSRVTVTIIRVRVEIISVRVAVTAS